MQIQSAQSAQFSGTAASEQTIVLKSKGLYSGLRISIVGSGTSHYADAVTAINSLTIDVPEYGARSRRVDVDSNTKFMLPIMSQLGALEQADADAATNVNGTTCLNVTDSFAYFDFPINKQNMEEDVRVTINMTPGTNAASTQTVYFSFLDYAFRPIYYRAFWHSAASSSIQQWFPSDGTLLGVVSGTAASSPAAGAIPAVWLARTAANVSQVSLNGEQETTFSFPQLLAGGLDETISGGTQGLYASADTYSMLKTFPITSGAQYVDITRDASVAAFILGVMTDA